MSAPLIVGGGPAGSSAAITLARGGVRPIVIERHRGTYDAICGGFLSWQSLARLGELGLNAEALLGHRVELVRLFHRQTSAQARLPQPGIGLSRRTLDSALIALAADAGAGIERGVRAARAGAAGVLTGDGAELAGSATILAIGKTSMVGQSRHPPMPALADPVVGLRLRLPAHPALGTMVGPAVELFLFDRGYAGLVIQEDGSANLCLAVHKSRLREAGGRPEGLVMEWAGECPPLAERLAHAEALPGADAIAAIPYGWIAPAPAGLWRVGDQLACIPSLAGEGMGIALWSGSTAARAMLERTAAENWHKQAQWCLLRPMRMAQWLWRLAESPRWAGAGMAVGRRAPWLIRAAAHLTRVPA